MKITIKKLVDWDEVYDSALFTQRKEVGDKKPTSKWKLKTCYAKHSILRDLIITKIPALYNIKTGRRQIIF